MYLYDIYVRMHVCTDAAVPAAGVPLAGPQPAAPAAQVHLPVAPARGAAPYVRSMRYIHAYIRDMYALYMRNIRVIVVNRVHLPVAPARGAAPHVFLSHTSLIMRVYLSYRVYISYNACMPLTTRIFSSWCGPVCVKIIVPGMYAIRAVNASRG
jgi:hypothetical protein